MTRRWPLFREELVRIVRGRTMKLLVPVMLYAVAATAFLMQRPPPEMMRAVERWFGASHAPLKLLLFIWTDTAMNKLAVVFGIVLAGGIIVDERTRGSWDVIASKPIDAGDYFTVRVLAAGAAFALVYTSAVLLGIAIFGAQVPGFAIAPFVTLSLVHVFAALFAVFFAGLMAVSFARKLTGMLASLGVLFALVGLAFIGFYWPALAPLGYLNPFSHGVALVAEVGDIEPAEVLGRIAALIAFDAAIVAAGRVRARALAEAA